MTQQIMMRLSKGEMIIQIDNKIIPDPVIIVDDKTETTYITFKSLPYEPIATSDIEWKDALDDEQRKIENANNRSSN